MRIDPRKPANHHAHWHWLTCLFFLLITPPLAGAEQSESGGFATLWDAPTGISETSEAGAWLSEKLDVWRAHNCRAALEFAGALDLSVPSRLLELSPQRESGERGTIIFHRDPIAESMAVLVNAETGCPKLFASGRLHPRSDRALPGIYASVDIPRSSGTAPILVLLQDSKSIRAWVQQVDRTTFEELSNSTAGWLGLFVAILMVLLVRACMISAWEQSTLAILYAFYIMTSLYYQLQALGIGPMWLPFWPGADAFKLMQSTAVALVIAGIGGLIIGFLKLRGSLLYTIAGGLVLTCGSFFASAWVPWLYKLGSVFILPLVLISITILLVNLRHRDRALNLFAIGLSASLAGGAVQAISILSGGSGVNALAIFAFPAGNLVEAVFWLMAIGARFRADQVALLTLYNDNRDLAARLVNAGERHRKKVAGELHDNLGQVMAALRMQLSAMKTANQLTVDDLNTLDQMVELTYNSARSAMYELQPDVIEIGLEGALRNGELEAMLDAANMQFSIEIDIGDHELSETRRINLFRIIQEAAHNSARHSGGTIFRVALGLSGDALNIEISDNGAGFERDAAKHGFGLGNIRDRATLMEAEYEFTTSSQGTCHRLLLPLSSGE